MTSVLTGDLPLASFIIDITISESAFLISKKRKRKPLFLNLLYVDDGESLRYTSCQLQRHMLKLAVAVAKPRLNLTENT